MHQSGNNNTIERGSSNAWVRYIDRVIMLIIIILIMVILISITLIMVILIMVILIIVIINSTSDPRDRAVVGLWRH